MSKGILWINVIHNIPEMLPVPAAHSHITLKFGVNESEVSHLIGKSVRNIRLHDNCYNDRIQAVKAELPSGIAELCSNKQPHMTISMASGVKPFESNKMLEGAHTVEYLDMLIDGEIEFHPFN